MNESPEKEEKFDIPVIVHVNKRTQQRLLDHQVRLINSTGKSTFSAAGRDIFEKGLDVAEKEVQDV